MVSVYFKFCWLVTLLPHLYAARVRPRARIFDVIEARLVSSTRTRRVLVQYTITAISLLVLLTIDDHLAVHLLPWRVVLQQTLSSFLNGLVTVSCRTEGWMFSFNSMYMYMYIVPLFVCVSLSFSFFSFVFWMIQTMRMHIHYARAPMRE